MKQLSSSQAPILLHAINQQSSWDVQQKSIDLAAGNLPHAELLDMQNKWIILYVWKIRVLAINMLC